MNIKYASALALLVAAVIITAGLYVNGFRSDGVAFTLGVMVMSAIVVGFKSIGSLQSS